MGRVERRAGWATATFQSGTMPGVALPSVGSLNHLVVTDRPHRLKLAGEWLFATTPVHGRLRQGARRR
jgi:hypothetical protein